MALNFGTAVVKNREVLDYGENFLYGDNALIDSAALEVRGGDLEDDVVVSVTFKEEDLADIALAVLDPYHGQMDEDMASDLAEGWIDVDEEDLLAGAWRLLRAVAILRAVEEKEEQVAA